MEGGNSRYTEGGNSRYTGADGSTTTELPGANGEVSAAHFFVRIVFGGGRRKNGRRNERRIWQSRPSFVLHR